MSILASCIGDWRGRRARDPVILRPENEIRDYWTGEKDDEVELYTKAAGQQRKQAGTRRARVTRP